MKTLAIIMTLLLGFLTSNTNQDFSNVIINDEINETVRVGLDSNGNPGVYYGDKANNGRGTYSEDNKTFHSGAGDLPVIGVVPPPPIPVKPNPDPVPNPGPTPSPRPRPNGGGGGGGASMPSFDWLEEIE